MFINVLHLIYTDRILCFVCVGCKHQHWKITNYSFSHPFEEQMKTSECVCIIKIQTSTYHMFTFRMVLHFQNKVERKNREHHSVLEHFNYVLPK